MHPLNLYLAGRAIDGIECGVQAAGMARASRDTTFTNGRRPLRGTVGHLPATFVLVISHEWLWQLRLCQARAELALARGAFDTAVIEATEGIEPQSEPEWRPNYQALGLITRRARCTALAARATRSPTPRQGIVVARVMLDPALLLLALDAFLALDGDDESVSRSAGARPSYFICITQ